MRRKLKMKLGIDFLMTLALLLLMPYELIGEAVHEWIGAGMFVLFVLHHILNRKWTGNLGKGRCTPFRIVQTFLVVLILISFLGSMVSGVILSRHLFAFLRIRGISALASRMHMVCAYWGFALMSLHLGIHWGMMVKTAQKHEEVTITSASFAGGEMSYLTVRDCMYLSFGDSWQCGGEVTVTLTCDGESSDYVLQSVKDAGVMTCEQALDCVREYDDTLFESLTNGRTFSGEIFIRLLYDEKCYYYVGVCDTEGKICAFLLDGESGRIVAEREHKM